MAEMAVVVFEVFLHALGVDVEPVKTKYLHAPALVEHNVLVPAIGLHGAD
jgi:hypothetical protein